MLHHHIHVTPANAGTILGATTGATISQQQQRQLKQAPAHTKTYTWTMRHTYALINCVVVHSNCLPPQPLCAQVLQVRPVEPVAGAPTGVAAAQQGQPYAIMVLAQAHLHRHTKLIPA
jgi:hypothetical protein